MTLMLNNVSVILFQPQIPENTGFIARSMNAFGLEDLRLVSPQFDWNETSPAYKTACGSHTILQQAKVFGSFQDAVSDSHQIVGFSRRNHTSPTKHLLFDDWLQMDRESNAKLQTALIFGREDFGLPREIISQCTFSVEIPQQHETISLNLSHAVSIALYLLSTQARINPSSVTSNSHTTPIKQEKLQLLYEQILNRNIKAVEPMNGKNKRKAEILYNYLQRTDITEDEFSVLMGFLK